MWLRSLRKLKVALSYIWSSTTWNYSKSKGATGRFEVKKAIHCRKGEFTFSSTARKHTGKTHSTPRSSKSKSELPPPKKAKHESGGNGCEGSSIELKEEEEEEVVVVEDGRSKAALPESRTEVAEDVKSSHSKPLGPGEEEVELMDTSEGGGDGGEKEERKKEDSNSLAAEKKDGSGSGTIEPTKTRKPVHPFFGNVS